MTSVRFGIKYIMGLVATSVASLSLTSVLLAAPMENREAVSAKEQPEIAWRDGLKEDLFANATIKTDSRRILIDAPYRADDAAIVPITLRLTPDLAKHVKKLTLIVDENPMPVAGEFSFGRASGRQSWFLSTRLRVNTYSFVRAVIETNDGKLFMNKAFVKAAGGCSAPAGKDEDAARASLGKIKIRQLRAASTDGNSIGQLMIKHPQYSGFQMDQLTGLYKPAEYISDITVKRGDDVVFTMTGGISISEDPNFRFSYDDNGRDPLTVWSKDIEERQFKASSSRGLALQPAMN